MKASIDSIESFGLVDGPGIRTVIFFKGCLLRCKYCHNPEMWTKEKENYTLEELVKKVTKNKPYFKRNNGGVTLSGGEPLLQIDFLIEFCKALKKEEIHIALDTSGVGIGKYKELLDLVDLILLDIKHVEENEYKNLTGQEIKEVEKFISDLNESEKPVWIRQVVVPGVNDNKEYLKKLSLYLKKIKNIEKIEFLPFHHLGFPKYEKLKIKNPLKETEEMKKEKCEELYEEFIKMQKEEK